MPHTYLVRCSDGTFYCGSTWHLERRVSEHNLGFGAAYTRIRRPVTLAWSVQLDSIRDAYFLEKQIQGWSHAKRLALVEGRLEDLPKLARTARPPAE